MSDSSQRSRVQESILIDRSVWKTPRIWCLAVAETLAWAGLLYLFPALLLRWESDFEWGRAVVSGALTSALVIAAVTGVFVGRLIDRGHGRVLMSASALAGAGLIAVLPVIDRLWQFYLIWSLVGVMMAGCLYEPCFAVVTRQFGTAAKSPIILITLVAGFAGTLCFPLATSIADAWGWRTSVWFFSFLVGGIAAPLFWFGVGSGALESGSGGRRVSVGLMQAARPVLSQPIFWLLAIAFGALSLNHGMIISHALPLMESRGVSPGVAVLAASLFGVAQVIGRLCLLGFNPRISLVSVCGWAFVALCLASVSLVAASTALIFLFLFVGLQGGGVGIQTIAKPVVTAEVLGRTHFGTISALVSFCLYPGVGFWSERGWHHLGIVGVYGSFESNVWAGTVGAALRAVDHLFESTAGLGQGRLGRGSCGGTCVAGSGLAPFRAALTLPFSLQTRRFLVLTRPSQCVRCISLAQ